MRGIGLPAAVRRRGARLRRGGLGSAGGTSLVLSALAAWSARRGGRRPVRRRGEAGNQRFPPGISARGFALVAVALALLVAAAFACGRGGDGDPVFVQQTDPYGRELAPAVARGARPAAVPARRSPAPPAASIGQEALLYRIGESPCAVLRAGLDGLAAGLCGEELRAHVYVRPDRPMRLAALIDRFAPFEVETAHEEVELHGRGMEVAGPIERRMVLEWARRLMAEARGVTATRPYRLAFEWQRQLQGGRECQALAVYLSGEAYATTCDGLRAAGTLSSERMAAILAWYEGLAPFQAVRQGGAAAESVSTRLIFPGAGDATQDDDTVKRMMGLAEALHTDLLAADLARRQAEEMRIAAMETAALAAAQGRSAAGEAGRQAAPARPWSPFPEQDAAEMTLSESIAVGADPEQVEEIVDEAGPGDEGGEEEEGGDGAAAAEDGEDDETTGAAEPAESDPPDDEDGGRETGGSGDPPAEEDDGGGG